MRRHTFRGVLTSLALAVAGTAFIAGPAQAASTTIKIDINSKTSTVKAEYGGFLGGVNGEIDYVDDQGQTVTAENGQADLEAKYPGQDWKVIASDTDPGFLYFGKAVYRAKINAQYRVHYSGGSFTDVNGATQPLDPSYSNVVTVKTLYKFSASGKCGSICHVHGKVAPSYKHKLIKVLVRHGKHGAFKRLKTFMTNAKSQFKGTLPGNRTYFYKFKVKGTKKFTGVVAGPYHIL